jgi:hypothetical protein
MLVQHYDQNSVACSQNLSPLVKLIMLQGSLINLQPYINVLKILWLPLSTLVDKWPAPRLLLPITTAMSRLRQLVACLS